MLFDNIVDSWVGFLLIAIVMPATVFVTVVNTASARTPWDDPIFTELSCPWGPNHTDMERDHTAETCQVDNWQHGVEPGGETCQGTNALGSVITTSFDANGNATIRCVNPVFDVDFTVNCGSSGDSISMYVEGRGFPVCEFRSPEDPWVTLITYYACPSLSN